MAKYYSAERNIQIVVALLKEYGISKIIASPGTTNLTFVASLQQDPYFTVYSAPEERSAAYMACGMAEESGEPVVITCTGATASRNYMPALTEAYYRKLPVVAITATQSRNIVGQLVPQVIDRTSQPKDTTTYSVHIPTIKDSSDETFAVLKVNEAFHHLRKNGGGPVHLNLETQYKMDFSVKELPKVKKIDFYQTFDKLPEIPDGKVGIFIGSHSAMSHELTLAIDAFCEANNAVVFCDHTSNYKGRFRIHYPLALSQDSWRPGIATLDVMIHIGEVSGAYCQPGGKQIWRVNPDGTIRNPYNTIKAVFEMREVDFFNHYAATERKHSTEFLQKWQSIMEDIRKHVPDDLPFSNIWIAQQLADRLPENSVLHLGILNSLRSWNFFEIPLSVDSYCNVGGFGIDGALSTVIGGALAQPERIHFIVLGDLAFFYDLNSLGNRHLPSNLRILLINNGRGTEFTNYNHPGHLFEEKADDYIAAAGHYGFKSKELVKHYARDLGMEYISVTNKEELLTHRETFLDSELRKTPFIMEAFTDSKQENDALYTIKNLKSDSSTILEHKVRQFIGPKGVEIAKKILKR